jgi:hypothetical protein
MLNKSRLFQNLGDCLLQAQIMTMPVLLVRGAPGERDRPQAHTDSWHRDDIGLRKEEAKSAAVLPKPLFR